MSLIKRIFGWLLLIGILGTASFWLAYGNWWLGSGGLVIKFTKAGVSYAESPDELQNVTAVGAGEIDRWPLPGESLIGSVKRLWSPENRSQFEAGVPIHLRPGTCTLTLSYGGRVLVRTDVVIKRGILTTNEITLESVPRDVVFTNLPARGLINGTHVEKTYVLTNRNVEHAHFAVELDGFKPYEFIVVPTNLSPVILISDLPLSERRGYLRVTVEPSGVVTTESNPLRFRSLLQNSAQWAFQNHQATTTLEQNYKAGVVYPVAPGPCEILVSAIGFATNTATVVVGEDATNAVNVQMQALPAIFTIVPTPPASMLGVTESGVTLHCVSNEITLTPGPHDLKLDFGTEYDVTTLHCDCDPASHYSNVVVLRKSGAAEFSRLVEVFNANVRSNSTLLQVFGGLEWTNILLAEAYAQTNYESTPSAGITPLNDVNSRLNLIVDVVQKRQIFHKTIEVAISSNIIDGFAAASDALKQYIRYLATHGIDADQESDIIALREKVHGKIIVLLDQTIDDFIRTRAFSAAQQWIAALPSTLGDYVPPDVIADILRRIQVLQREDEAQRRRTAFAEALRQDDYAKANELAGGFTATDPQDSRLLEELASKRRLFVTQTLRREAKKGAGNEHSMVNTLRTFVADGGQAELRLVEEFGITALLLEKQVKTATRFVDALGADASLSLWTKDQRDELKQKIRDFPDPRTLFFDDFNAIQKLEQSLQ